MKLSQDNSVSATNLLVMEIFKRVALPERTRKNRKRGIKWKRMGGWGGERERKKKTEREKERWRQGEKEREKEKEGVKERKYRKKERKKGN